VQLVNEFVVPRPIDQTWDVLNDVERIAPAMPGATLTDHVDDVYHGKVKVKVGPVTAQYAGTAQFKERDEAARHMVLEATGKESSGRGRASALVNVDLTAEGAETRVKVVTDLTISGPLAQFGRGAIAEVSSKLLGQFVTNLHTMVLADEPTPTANSSTGTGTASAPAPSAPSATAASVDSGAPATAPSDTSTGPAPTTPGSSAGAASAGEASAGAASPGAASAGAAVTDTSAPGATSSTAAPTAASSGSGATSAGPAAAAPASSATSAAPSTSARATSVPASPRAQPAEAPAAEVNLLKIAAWPILKRLIPVLVVVAIIVIVLVVWVF
jgi:carbon monoxide dehydrogenase subunit G